MDGYWWSEGLWSYEAHGGEVDWMASEEPSGCVVLFGPLTDTNTHNTHSAAWLAMEAGTQDTAGGGGKGSSSSAAAVWKDITEVS